MNSPVTDTLVGALEALITALRSADVPVEVVGGIAVSLLGRPRFSRDIDALVFARRSRVLLLRHGPSQIDIDVILSGLPFDRAIVASGQPRSLSRD